MKLRRIRYKIAIPSIIIITILGIFVLTIDHIRTSRIGLMNYKVMGESILRNSEKHIAHHMYLNDFVELQQIIDNIKFKEIDIVYIFIINNRNFILSHTFNNGIPKGLLEFNNTPQINIEEIQYGNQLVYDFSYPIENGNLGIVRMGLSGVKLTEDLKAHIFYLIVLFVFFLFIGIIVAFVISGRITVSIDKLLNSVQKIAHGDFKERVNIKTLDEIGDLAASINFMAESLQTINEELEEKIVTLEVKKQEIELINNDLKLAKIKAEESDRLKTEFLNNISHEIRTPMNAIHGFTSMLLKPTINESQKTRYISIINSSTNNLLGVINDIICISRINTEQVEINVEEINIHVLLNNIYSKYKAIADGQKIKFVISKPKGAQDIKIVTDYIKLDKILNSLVSNALKFTHDGEVSITYSIKNEFIEFIIKDTGIGIEQKHQDKIFYYFSKIKKDDNTIYSGIGLGLSISKSFINMLGGKLWFDSKINEGSTFYFTLPLISQTLKRKSNSFNIDSFENENKILIVEDEILNYLYLEEVLHNVNARLLHAKTGKEAVELFEKNANINLILMDIKLPDTNGYILTKQFKQTRPNIPIIAQTAYAMQGDRKKVFDAGCDDYISKPINMTEILDKIKRYIN